MARLASRASSAAQVTELRAMAQQEQQGVEGAQQSAGDQGPLAAFHGGWQSWPAIRRWRKGSGGSCVRAPSLIPGRYNGLFRVIWAVIAIDHNQVWSDVLGTRDSDRAGGLFMHKHLQAIGHPCRSTKAGEETPRSEVMCLPAIRADVAGSKLPWLSGRLRRRSAKSRALYWPEALAGSPVVFIRK